VKPLTHLLTYSLTHSLIYSLTHLLTHSLTYCVVDSQCTSACFSADGKLAVGYRLGGIKVYQAYRLFPVGDLFEQLPLPILNSIIAYLQYPDVQQLRYTRTHSPTHLITHLLTHLLTHSPTHSPTHSL
jgi:hypothetical protein